MVPPEYQARQDGEHLLPAVSPKYLNERNTRRWVDYTGPEEPGTIVVDPYARVLYHVMEPGRASVVLGDEEMLHLKGMSA